MTPPKSAIVGPRRFQWNAGGWFGASLGSSAWMLLAAFMLGYHNQPVLALVPAGGFGVVLIASIWLWGRRDRNYPFSAMMILLGLTAIVLPLVWISVSLNVSPAAAAAMSWPRSAWTSAVVSAVVPLLMAWFLFLEHSTTPDRKVTSSGRTSDAS